MPINRKLQNIIGTEHITDAAETAIAAQASGGATVAFKNVAVSGQDNIVADAATDTLNIAAGSNITLTTNAGTDTLTIAAAGGTTGYTYTDTDGSEQFLISDTSDTSLFKIEQAGTGNVLEAHDQASDTTIFKIDNAGKTVIGGTSASTTHAAFFLYVNGDTRLSRLRVGTGSNGEPGIHFEGDSDTGIRRSDADKLGFITGGSERLSIGSAGEVLVGGSAAGTSGQVLTSGGSGAAVSWAAGGGGTYEQFGDMSSIHADRKYIYPNTLPPFSMHQTSFSSQTISDDIIFSPVLFLNDITVSEIGVHVASASGPFEVALYSSNANLLPATRMHTAASFSAPGAGNIFTASIPGGNITLSANTRYYIGVTNTTNGTNTSVRTVGSAGTTMKIGSDINRCAIAIFLGTNNSLPATIPQDTNLAELYRAPMVILVEA